VSVRDIHGFVRLSLQKRPVTIPMRGFLWGADVGCFQIWDLIDMQILSKIVLRYHDGVSLDLLP
jgi:hypothetical protein